MLNPQSSNHTIAKLLEVDADLAAREVELATQLVKVQEKRHSLKTVIDLFAPVDTATMPVATPVQQPVTEAAQDVVEANSPAQTLIQDTVIPELNGANANTTTEAPAAPIPQKQQAKNSSFTTSKQGKKSAPTNKTSKALESWQEYVRSQFSNVSLAEAVSEVMQQQKEQLLEIAAIVDTIFVDEIPRKVRSTARERVSNVLSVGAKNGKWYRGQLGKYSMSKAVANG